MCGICGEYNFGTRRPATLEDLRRMTESIAHRGPDDEGFFLRGPVGFGFRRLSIIDLEGGRQPMCDVQQKVWLVFNGEIYNFAELRAQLEGLGHQFRTKSDTEVILHGYKQWGKDVLNRLNGMFGLAIWDEDNKRLMLARDRLGIKPVYYRLDSDGLIFGSEIRAIVARTGERPEVDATALNLFLRYRYTPSPLTAFKGIRKLAAGTRLVVENGTPILERWWNFHPTPFDPMPTAEEAEQTLLQLYQKAVKRHLISDVPVGLFLSGGLDSGLLLALMSGMRSDWKTFSIGFGNSFQNDELKQAAETAHYFGSQHVPIELSRSDFESNLPKIIGAVEEPVAAGSIVPMYFLCQRARQDVKVALMGQGPDELFGGYRRHLFARYASYGRRFPDTSHFVVSSVLNHVLDRATTRRLLASLEPKDTMLRYQNIFSHMPGGSVDGLFQDGILTTDIDDELLGCWHDLMPLMADTDELGGLQFLELRSSLPDELLLYADKLSMAHGLEVRVPYLDHEIVEYGERLSSSLKVRNGSRKWLHRKVCRRLLPRQSVRNKKIGFETPNTSWFRPTIGGQTSDYLEDRDSEIYNVLRYDAVRSVVREHQSGEYDHDDFLFSLMVLEVWLRGYGAQVGAAPVGLVGK